MAQIPKVLHETDEYVVIDKPTGLTVTPGTGHSEKDTLVGWIIDRYGESIRTVCVEGHRPGIVHRLDKDTSGVMVIVKTIDAFNYMVSQFKERRVTKKYESLVWGDVKDTLKRRGYTSETFDINAPIGRNPRNRTHFAVTRGGKEARTSFLVGDVVVLKGTMPVTAISCTPFTGRTHQIRVHIKSFGHGVVGDVLYQSRSETQKLNRLVDYGLLKNRLYLHSRSLSFIPYGESSVQSFTSSVPWRVG